MREGRLGRCSSEKKRGEKRSAAISTGRPSPLASLCQKREGFFTTPSPRILTLCLLSLLSARSASQYHATSGFGLLLVRHRCAICEVVFRDACFLHFAGIDHLHLDPVKGEQEGGAATGLFLGQRGYVDILCAATEASNTMNGGDFGSLPRITDGCGPCAMYLKDSVDSLFRYDSHFPGQTSISRTRKPERRRADRPETTAAATG
ncbi:uncharacterized protein LOC120798384 isoform X1 [Xiphias gladius]|uniref:uncharacterized protein LOC120798384 isoform X1 n=1 Tax=Xiphias gladius TaxID=8245 RepID=UPI001A994E01|nr:uncharacterized protein LOC120798384 isoform X1 [Xiphias gladius]